MSNRIRHGHGHGTDAAASALISVINVVDVIGPAEGIPVVGASEEIEELAGKEINACVNPGLVQSLHPRPQSCEVRFIELREIKLWLAVGCQAGTGPLPGKWSNGELRRIGGNNRQTAELGRFHGPKQCEIVSVRGKEFNEPCKIQRLRRAIRSPVLQGVPRLRATQHNVLSFAVLEVMMVCRGG